MAKLTPKQERFVEEYLVDLNATQAAIRAGYSAHTAKQQGARLLTNVDVAQKLGSARERLVERTEISQDRVLKEYAAIAFADIRNAVKWGTAAETIDGKEVRCTTIELFDSAGLKPEVAAAISEVSQTKEGLKVKFHGKQGALDAIAKHLGMFVERHEVDVKLSLEALVDESMQTIGGKTSAQSAKTGG